MLWGIDEAHAIPLAHVHVKSGPVRSWVSLTVPCLMGQESQYAPWVNTCMQAMSMPSVCMPTPSFSPGETGALKLDNPKNNFERGQKDVFAIRAEDVGKLQKMKVGVGKWVIKKWV